MTLNKLRALSEGYSIRFYKAALEQIMLRPKGADEEPLGNFRKSSGLCVVSLPVKNKAKTTDAMDNQLPTQALEEKVGA